MSFKLNSCSIGFGPTRKHLPWSTFQQWFSTRLQPGLFRGLVSFLEQGHFNEHLMYYTQKKYPQGTFVAKSGHLLSVFKNRHGRNPSVSPLVARLCSQKPLTIVTQLSILDVCRIPEYTSTLHLQKFDQEIFPQTKTFSRSGKFSTSKGFVLIREYFCKTRFFDNQGSFP